MGGRRWTMVAIFAGAALALLVLGSVALDPGLTVIAEALGGSLFLGGLALAAASLDDRPRWQRLGLGPSHLSLPQLALLVAGALALSRALMTVVNLLGAYEQSNMERLDESIRNAQEGSAAALLLALAIAPSICEELLFRGFVQRELVGFVGGPLAVIGASLLFGLAHGEPVHGSVAFVIGLYFGAAALLGGSVRPAILCHLTNNLLAVLDTTWGWGISWDTPGSILPLVGFSILALFVAGRRGGPAAVDPEAPS